MGNSSASEIQNIKLYKIVAKLKGIDFFKGTGSGN